MESNNDEQKDKDKTLKRLAKLDKNYNKNKTKKIKKDAADKKKDEDGGSSDSSSDSDGEDQTTVLPYTLSDVHFLGERGRGYRWYARNDFLQFTIGSFLRWPDGSVTSTERISLYPSEVVELFQNMEQIQELGAKTKKEERSTKKQRQVDQMFTRRRAK